MSVRTPSSRPGPSAQKINAWLHREPQASISYCLYWTIFFAFWTPIAIVFLQIQMIAKLVSWYKGKDYYDPKQHLEKELAIVVTGCDSGFGKGICLWAADAGFVVFAACLKTESIEEFGHHGNIHAMVMDVTSDRDVTNVVLQVKKWLDDKASKKQRLLHGLINNAGIWTGAETDWTDLSVYQKVMDGTYRTCLWRSLVCVLTFCTYYSQLFWHGPVLQGIYPYISRPSHSQLLHGRTHHQHV
jgi:hypothetical protein